MERQPGIIMLTPVRPIEDTRPRVLPELKQQEDLLNNVRTRLSAVEEEQTRLRDRQSKTEKQLQNCVLGVNLNVEEIQR